MALLTQSYLREKARVASGYYSENNIRAFANEALAEIVRAAGAQQAYDIFLSHASEDAILIKALRDELVELGFTVYVDWIEDPYLDRNHVTRYTARVLRERMRKSKCLLFATSVAARESVWMPWELGYVDAQTHSRVAIAPMVADNEEGGEFKGQEYLGLYPYLDKTGQKLYVHTSHSEWVNFGDWLAGKDPHRH